MRNRFLSTYVAGALCVLFASLNQCNVKAGGFEYGSGGGYGQHGGGEHNHYGKPGGGDLGHPYGNLPPVIINRGGQGGQGGYIAPGAVQFQPGAVQGGQVAPGAIQFRQGAVQGGYIAPGAVRTQAVGIAPGGLVLNTGAQIPAYQTIRYVNTPGLGVMYTPNSAPCYAYASEQTATEGVGQGLTIPSYSLPCHWQELAKTSASVGQVAVNAGSVIVGDENNPIIPASPETVEAGRKAITDSINLLRGTDVNYYLLSRAEGREPPIKPTRGILDIFPGGMVADHVVINPDYKPPRLAPRHDYYNVPDPKAVNKRLDPIFKEEMGK